MKLLCGKRKFLFIIPVFFAYICNPFYGNYGIFFRKEENLKKETPNEAFLKGEGMKKFKHLSNVFVSFDKYIIFRVYELPMCKL